MATTGSGNIEIKVIIKGKKKNLRCNQRDGIIQSIKFVSFSFLISLLPGFVATSLFNPLSVFITQSDRFLFYLFTICMSRNLRAYLLEVLTRQHHEM